jgi:hypothetical protein
MDKLAVTLTARHGGGSVGLLDSLGIERSHFIGASMGGSIAREAELHQSLGTSTRSPSPVGPPDHLTR